jgi:hypothetical protein
MGVVLLILGLGAAGVIADFLVENGLGEGPDRTFELFGTTFQMSTTEVVLGAAILGAIAIALVAIGLGVMGVEIGRRRERRAERRDLEGRVDALLRRNDELERLNGELAREVAETRSRSTPAAAATADRSPEAEHPKGATGTPGPGRVVDVNEERVSAESRRE